MLKANPNKINWDFLSKNSNPEAIQILKANPDKINWWALSQNPNIFYDEYEAIAKDYFREFVTEDLIATVWHPRNIAKFAGLGIDLDS